MIRLVGGKRGAEKGVGKKQPIRPLAPPRHLFKCREKSLHLKNVGVTKNGSKKSKFEKKNSYALGTLKSHFVPKNQILAIFGSAQHLVRLK